MVAIDAEILALPIIVLMPIPLGSTNWG